MKPALRRGYVGLLLCLLCSQTANAWSNIGHRITGLIAESLLTNAAHRQIEQLLGEQSLSIAATHMDTYRTALAQRWPESDRWHYDNQPVCQHRDYCADGNCATRQIALFRKQLANREASLSERALALRLLVHMLGDIHQPLHMADNADRGGNSLQVRLYAGGDQYPLHEVLDSVLIKQLQGSMRIKNYAASLQQRYQGEFAHWQHGTIQDWAKQSHTLAVQQVYGRLPGFACGHQQNSTLTLSADYVSAAKTYLPEQLAKAGARIAQVLNSTLK
ncbi:MAG: S1/P1 nuclease [Steroidobacteraceae bacterium]